MSSDTVTIQLDLNSVESYKTFLAIKGLPRYRFVGRTAIIPAEYASRLGIGAPEVVSGEYKPIPGLFDYQRDVSRIAIAKRKFAVFARCGLGKTLVMLEFARHAQKAMGSNRRVLIVSPLMVIAQTIEESNRFYQDAGVELVLEQVKARDLSRWTQEAGSSIGITNYEALTDGTPQGRLGALILDEASMLKSHYGKHGQQCLRLGAGLDWKLCLTGTPAPNDRIEFANHAVFLDAFPSINSFLARFFFNRCETANRWQIKPHAVEPFYRALSHWSIFLENPETYGWKDNVHSIPPIEVHIHDVDLTTEQREMVGLRMGTLFANDVGGITNRSALSQIAKGNYKGRKIETNKPAYIRNLVDSWPDESTIIWCRFDEEQRSMERAFPDAASIWGPTKFNRRLELIRDFQNGHKKILISKCKVLGFGLNLQIATRHVFSGLQDSFEEFHQAISRSNRVGSTKTLNVHIPITDVEAPMVSTVLKKANRVMQDVEIQEQIFKSQSILGVNHVA